MDDNAKVRPKHRDIRYYLHNDLPGLVTLFEKWKKQVEDIHTDSRELEHSIFDYMWEAATPVDMLAKSGKLDPTVADNIKGTAETLIRLMTFYRNYLDDAWLALNALTELSQAFADSHQTEGAIFQGALHKPPDDDEVDH